MSKNALAIEWFNEAMQDLEFLQWEMHRLDVHWPQGVVHIFFSQTRICPCRTLHLVTTIHVFVPLLLELYHGKV